MSTLTNEDLEEWVADLRAELDAVSHRRQWAIERIAALESTLRLIGTRCDRRFGDSDRCIDHAPREFWCPGCLAYSVMEG